MTKGQSNRKWIFWVCGLVLAVSIICYFLLQSKQRTSNSHTSSKVSQTDHPERQCTSRAENDETVFDCRYFYKDGKLRGISSYKEGIPHGNFRVYYHHGQLRQEHAYIDGKRIGSYKRYYPEGGLAQQYDYIPNTPRKVARYFYPDGSMMGQEELQNNRFEGGSQFFDPSGKELMHLTAKDNTFYDEEGQIMEGSHIIHYPKGKPLLVSQYQNGQLHGSRIMFRESGKKVWEYNFRHGLAEGLALEHYTNGSVRVHKHYRNHILYKEEEFDPQGNLIFVGNYVDPAPQISTDKSKIQASEFGR